MNLWYAAFPNTLLQARWSYRPLPPTALQFTVRMRLRKALTAFLRTLPKDSRNAQSYAVPELASILEERQAPLLLSECNKIALSNHKCCSQAAGLPNTIYGAEFWEKCRANAQCGWCSFSTATPSLPEAISLRRDGLSGISIKFLELICDVCLLATFGAQVTPDLYDYVICVCGGWHRLIALDSQASGELRVAFNPCYHYRPSVATLEDSVAPPPDYLACLPSMPSTPSIYTDDPSPAGVEYTYLPEFGLSLPGPLQPQESAYDSNPAPPEGNPKKRKPEAKFGGPASAPKRRKGDGPSSTSKTFSFSITTNICSQSPGGEYYVPAPGVAPLSSRLSSRSHLGHPTIAVSTPLPDSSQAKKSDQGAGTYSPRPPAVATPSPPPSLPIHTTHTNIQRIAGANFTTNTIDALNASIGAGLGGDDDGDDDDGYPRWDTTTYHHQYDTTVTTHMTSYGADSCDPNLLFSSLWPDHGE